MVTIWNLDKPASFSDILEANPDINRNTLLAALRKLQSYGFIRVAGFGYHKNSLTRLFESALSMVEYFSQFMSADQKKAMISALEEDLSENGESASGDDSKPENTL